MLSVCMCSVTTAPKQNCYEFWASLYAGDSPVWHDSVATVNSRINIKGHNFKSAQQ